MVGNLHQTEGEFPGRGIVSASRWNWAKWPLAWKKCNLAQLGEWIFGYFSQKPPTVVYCEEGILGILIQSFAARSRWKFVFFDMGGGGLHACQCLLLWDATWTCLRLLLGEYILKQKTCAWEIHCSFNEESFLMLQNVVQSEGFYWFAMLHLNSFPFFLASPTSPSATGQRPQRYGQDGHLVPKDWFVIVLPDDPGLSQKLFVFF